ncbi:MAG TPA: aldolase [Candidatus Nanoarchaeia archaeon]|nr:aldolase [Candidatus Nanoarchaeia archaeon]
MKKTEYHVPADVPKTEESTYRKNMELIAKGTDRLMLFAGDQRVEHLNDDFYGTADTGTIPAEDNDPEHLFRIASQGVIGCFATQFGMIAKYGKDYDEVPYVVKLNSKSHLVKTAQKDPMSKAWVSVEQALELKKAGLNIVGIGYTVYLGSEFEGDMITEAEQAIIEAHKNGLVAIIWMYPRGKAVPNEKDPHLIAGAAGVAATLGTDFVKVNYPKAPEGQKTEEAFREATQAAGRTRVITAGGSSTDVRKFLETLWKQIHVSGAKGSATGRNIHQKPLHEAINMTKAISAITYADKSVDEAMEIYEGKKEFKI